MEIKLELSNFLAISDDCKSKNKLASNPFVLLSEIRHQGAEGIQEATGFMGNVVG